MFPKEFDDTNIKKNDPKILEESWGPFALEGWACFNGGPEARLEQIDELQAWETDMALHQFIVERALAGSKGHIEALKEVRQNPDEWEFIQERTPKSLWRILLEKIDE